MPNILNSFTDKEILKKSIQVLIIRVLGYGFGFGFIWFIANKYGSENQGIFSIAFLFLSVGTMISKLGMETSLVKWIASSGSRKEEKFFIQKSIKLILISSILVSVLVYFFSSVISSLYQKPDVNFSIKIAALGIPLLSVFDVLSSFFKGKKLTAQFGIYYFCLKFSLPLLIIAIGYYYDIENNFYPILSYTIGILFGVIFIVLHLLRVFKSVKVQVNSVYTYKYMFFHSAPMMIASSVVMIMGWCDVFILGFYVSESEIGIYSTAVKLATIVSFIYAAINTITTPKIAKFYNQKESDKLRNTVEFSSKLMTLAGLPIFLILFVFPEFFLSFFGEEYIKGTTVLRILLVAQFTNVLTGPVGPLFQMTGKQTQLQNIIILSLLINVLLSIVLVNILRLEGVAIGSAAGMICWNMIGALYIKKRMKLQTWIKLK